MAWNQSTNKTRTAPRGKSTRKIATLAAIGFLVVVLGCFVAVNYFSNQHEPETKRPHTAHKGIIMEVKPSFKPGVAREEPEIKVDRKKTELEKIRAKVKGMNADERALFAEEMLAKRDIDLDPKTNRPFMTSVELQMARIFTKQLGDTPPPPMPPISSYEYIHLTKILISDNPVLPTDSEEWKEAKGIVEVAKKEMQKYIKEGGDPDDFINYYYGLLTDAYNERMMCTRELMKTAIAEPEIASELYRRYNERLASKGIKQIELPQHIKEKYSIED